MHGFACVFLPHFLYTRPRSARPERVSATALKPPRKAGGRGGESTAHIQRQTNKSHAMRISLILLIISALLIKLFDSTYSLINDANSPSLTYSSETPSR
ncbi:hypothetical protein GF069_24340 [Escherichia coli]|nr:hypothetical protein [Escherichia coli]